jgi:hypothetical protein
MTTSITDYDARLVQTFDDHRRHSYAKQLHMFEARPAGGPVVFSHANRDANVLMAPFAQQGAEP